MPRPDVARSCLPQPMPRAITHSMPNQRASFLFKRSVMLIMQSVLFCCGLRLSQLRVPLAFVWGLSLLEVFALFFLRPPCDSKTPICFQATSSVQICRTHLKGYVPKLTLRFVLGNRRDHKTQFLYRVKSLAHICHSLRRKEY